MLLRERLSPQHLNSPFCLDTICSGLDTSLLGREITPSFCRVFKFATHGFQFFYIKPPGFCKYWRMAFLCQFCGRRRSIFLLLFLCGVIRFGYFSLIMFRMNDGSSVSFTTRFTADADIFKLFLWVVVGS